MQTPATQRREGCRAGVRPCVVTAQHPPRSLRTRDPEKVGTLERAALVAAFALGSARSYYCKMETLLVFLATQVPLLPPELLPPIFKQC